MDSLDSSGILQSAANSNHTHRQIAADHSIQALGSFPEQNYSESTDSEGAIEAHTVQIIEQAQSFGTRSSRIVEIEVQETGSEQEFSSRDESADARGVIPVQAVQITGKDQSFATTSSRIVEIEEEETGSEEAQNRGKFQEKRNQIGGLIWHFNRSLQMIEGAALRHVIPRSDVGALMEYMGNRKIRPCPAGARMYGEFELDEMRSILLSNQRYIPRAGERIRFYVVDGGRWLWLMGLHRNSPGQIAVELDAVIPNFGPQGISYQDPSRLNLIHRRRAVARPRNASQSLFCDLFECIASCFYPTP